MDSIGNMEYPAKSANIMNPSCQHLFAFKYSLAGKIFQAQLCSVGKLIKVLVF